MSVLRVRGNGSYLDSHRLEFRGGVGKRSELGGADEGVVEGVEEEDEPLPC